MLTDREYFTLLSFSTSLSPSELLLSAGGESLQLSSSVLTPGMHSHIPVGGGLLLPPFFPVYPVLAFLMRHSFELECEVEKQKFIFSLLSFLWRGRRRGQRIVRGIHVWINVRLAMMRLVTRSWSF
jgi:hypothetical protein